MTQGIILARRTAHITNGELKLDGLAVRDADVLTLVAGSDNAETAVRHALTVGARALNLAHAVEVDPSSGER